jgi:hypothetical protein
MMHDVPLSVVPVVGAQTNEQAGCGEVPEVQPGCQQVEWWPGRAGMRSNGASVV